jgi:hypothetical protein
MATKRSRPAPSVSPNNPCPFLRALVAQRLLPDGTVALGELSRTVAQVARTGEGRPRLPAAAVYAIGLIAHGLSPVECLKTQWQGLRLDGLRDGPLDKHGVGSGILDATGTVDLAELKRLDQFAGDQTDADGLTERGLDLAGLTRMMDANAERAGSRRRLVDRKLMDGEWPVLLKVMGKPGRAGRYLSLAELRELFVARRLPARMLARLPRGA